MNVFHEKLSSLMSYAEKEKSVRDVEEMETQKREGKCTLIPFPKSPAQPFRSELTVESIPLFVVNSFKEDWWSYERELTHPKTREVMIQRVTVGKVHEDDRSRGVLRQIHQEMFYRLLKLWGERGYLIESRDGEDGASTVGVLNMSAYELVMELRGGDSTKHYRRVQEVLEDLASVPIVCETISQERQEKEKKKFRLLSDVEWHEKKVDPKTGRPKPGGFSKVTILFSPSVTDGFLKKNVKQLLMGPYQALGTGRYGRRGELARLLYPILDRELSTKDSFRAALSQLAQRLGMPEYPSKEHRKRPFVAAINLLEGKLILGEKYRLTVELKPASDGTDYVLFARRGPDQLHLAGME